MKTLYFILAITCFTMLAKAQVKIGDNRTVSFRKK